MSEALPGRPRYALAAVSLLGFLCLSSPAPALADAKVAGAYCPIPAHGEQPTCLAPARSQYAHFHEAIEAGAFDPAATEQVERDLSSGQHTYLALSSLTYAYYQLAERAAHKPEANPTLVARLEHWNELLSTLYADDSTDANLREALRSAAADLYERAPRLEFPCAGASAADDSCSPTATLVSALRAIDEQQDTTGVRGALSRLVDRFLSNSEHGSQSE